MRVAGLVAAHQHNGKSGTVCSAVDQSTGRVEVTLDEGGSLKIKPFNLVPILLGEMVTGAEADRAVSGPCNGIQLKLSTAY